MTDIHPTIWPTGGNMWCLDLIGNIDPTGNKSVHESEQVSICTHLEDLREISRVLNEFFTQFDGIPETQ